MRMRPFGRLISYQEALHRLLRALEPVLRRERIPLAAALGRVTSSDVRSRTDVPPFPRATWDGYAVRSASTRGARPAHPRSFRVVGEVFAEGGYRGGVGREEAAAIATGGPMPPGTDSVVIFEEVPLRNGYITVRRYVSPGERVAVPGEDFPRGSTLAAGGVALTPAALGALAASGATTVEVYRKPRVAILPNGNELVPPGARRGADQIFESNNLLLGPLVEALGGIPLPHPPIADDPEAITLAIRQALRDSDLVLVTGGSSVGERDYLPQIFPRLGRMIFHGVAVRPGKPTLAVKVGSKLVIGLPGHPTSCLSNGFWLLLPVLRKLGHRSGTGTIPSAVRMAAPYTVAPGGFATVVPLHVRGGRAWPTFKGSSAITSLTAANAFVIVPPNGGALRRGELRTVELLPAPIAELEGGRP
jgi:molybdopterin molybdotransferase